MRQQFQSSRRCGCESSRPYHKECGGHQPKSNSVQVFMCGNTIPQKILGHEAAQLSLGQILYSYGNAIMTSKKTDDLYITQPGLYQVYYSIEATNAGALGSTNGISTLYLLKNHVPFCETRTKALDLGETDAVQASEYLYIAPHELPAKIELMCASMASIMEYTVSLSIHKLCTCEEDAYLNAHPVFPDGCTPDDCQKPGQGHGCNCGNGCDNDCSNNCGNNCGCGNRGQCQNNCRCCNCCGCGNNCGHQQPDCEQKPCCPWDCNC